MSLGITWKPQLTGTLTPTATGSRPSEQFNAGSNSWPSVDVSLSSSNSGALEATQWYCAQRTLLAAGTDDLTLSGGGSLINNLGQSLALTQVRFLWVQLTAPDGTLKLRVGPNGVANAWIGPFSAAAAYVEVFDQQVFMNVNGATGWAVGGATNVLRITNPSASSITYQLLIAG